MFQIISWTNCPFRSVPLHVVNLWIFRIIRRVSKIILIFTIFTNHDFLLKPTEKIFELPVTFSGCKRLEKLDVSSNQIQYCDVLKEMGFLKVLNLRTNSIEEFPEADLEDLVKLDLSKNKLSAFPRNLKAMKSLKKLEMAHNQINVIPSELGNGQLLEEIDLSWNNLGLVLPILFT